jgi:hypothetical protein
MSRARLMDAVPPPPAGPSLASRQIGSPSAAPAKAARPMPGVGEHPAEASAAAAPLSVYPFDAELELAELDDRGKPGAPWSARARTLSRGTLSANSRRMCHADRRVLIAVHRVDDLPAVLLGRVASCRYESGGLYVIDFELLPLDAAEAKVMFSRRAR